VIRVPVIVYACGVLELLANSWNNGKFYNYNNNKGGRRNYDLCLTQSHAKDDVCTLAHAATSAWIAFCLMTIYPYDCSNDLHWAKFSYWEYRKWLIEYTPMNDIFWRLLDISISQDVCLALWEVISPCYVPNLLYSKRGVHSQQGGNPPEPWTGLIVFRNWVIQHR